MTTHRSPRRVSTLAGLVLIGGCLGVSLYGQAVAPPPPLSTPAAPQAGQSLGPDVAIGEADCTASRLGDSVPVAAIGEKVASVTLTVPRWTAPTATARGHCTVDGVMAPIDTRPTARPINFRVVLPAAWNRRAAQLGGGGLNGTIPNLTGGPDAPLSRGFATFGSDSGHQAGGGRGAPADPAINEWVLNDEAMKNLGYMQMKKTRDAAMVVIERMYKARPRFTYFIGTSQGGREALTVAQRYPTDYDGIVANVPIVGFSSLMLAPELIRIQEKPLANWVTPAKVNAIRGEFIRQCDDLDGLADGIINNYLACRAIFDTTQGARNRKPWAAKRCPDNVDPNPADTTADACLTDGQISTLEFVYRPYRYASPLAHGVRSFGMWLPNTDPSGSGLIANTRWRGQEGAPENAPLHAHLGVLGVTGFLMQDLSANPLDYVEGRRWNARRVEISAHLDGTNPDLAAFSRRGGRAIVTIGTNDTLASPGAQLDYYQALLDKMGRRGVDRMARLFVMPQAGHGLSGSSYTTDGQGRAVTPAPIPNAFDRLTLLMNWVEKNEAPGMSVTVTAGERSLPLCSYPAYPRYVSGDRATAASYTCATR
jgi:feruloyl esterase